MEWVWGRSCKGGEEGLHFRDIQKARGPLSCLEGQVHDTGVWWGPEEGIEQIRKWPWTQWQVAPWLPDPVVQAPLRPDRCKHRAGPVAGTVLSKGPYLWQVCFGFPGAPDCLQGDQNGSQLPWEA